MALTRHFIEDWGFDGLTLDNIYSSRRANASPYQSARGFCRGFCRGLPSDSADDKRAQALQRYPDLPLWQPADVQPAAVLRSGGHRRPGQQRAGAPADQVLQGAARSARGGVFADHVELSDARTDCASALGTGGIPGTSSSGLRMRAAFRLRSGRASVLRGRPCGSAGSIFINSIVLPKVTFWILRSGLRCAGRPRRPQGRSTVLRFLCFWRKRQVRGHP